MKFHNQGEYVSDSQLNQLFELMPIEMRTLRVDVYIAKSEEFFISNRLTPKFEKDVRAVLKTGAEGGFFGKSNKKNKWDRDTVIVFEDLIVKRYDVDQLHWTFVFLLIHELRHCEQLNFFKERWPLLQNDYQLNYMETANTLEDIHWCEQDAYTYAYRFLENKKSEIMVIFQLKTMHDISPIDFDIDMVMIWKAHKRKLNVVARTLWFIADLSWPVRQMSKQHKPDSCQSHDIKSM